MARAKVVELPLLTGAVTDDTVLASKFYATDMDKTRARGKRWETIKGWNSFNASGMTSGIARAAHTFADLKGNPILVAASESAFNAWMGGTRIDITPKWKDVWIDGGTSLRSVTAHILTMQWNVYQPSTGVSVLSPHDLVVGDTITISNVAKTSGDVTLAGTFPVTEIIDLYQFKIDVGSGTIISVTQPFTVTMPFRIGLVTGTGDTPATKPRSYSIDNFGENAVFCGSDGTPVFFWQPAASTPNIIVNGTFSSALAPPWTVGGAGGWTFGGGGAGMGGTNIVDARLIYDVSKKVLEGGKTYEMSFQVVSSSNLVQFRVMIDTIDIWPKVTTNPPASFLQTYTFRFVCPANPLQLIFTATTSVTLAGGISLDNVSIKLVPTAQPLNEAPQKNFALFVDGNGILTTLGSVEADGDFNPMLMRWCDTGNYRKWVPDSSNVAGELPLGVGSYAVCGKAVGPRNLILTDDAAYAATFTANGYNLALIATGCGAMSTQSLAVVNARAYWPSKKAICYYDGQQVTSLECSIKTTFAGKISQYQENKVFAWRNIEYQEIWIHYPHQAEGTEVSRYLIYNLLDPQNPWAFGTLNRTCMTKAGIFRSPIGFDVSGAVWNHDVGSDMPGGLILPFMESGFITSEAADEWVGCRRYYPDIQGQIGNIRFSVTGKRAPQGQLNTQTIGPLVMYPNKRTVDFLISCRQLKFKWVSEATPTNWRLGIVGLEMKPGKSRR